MRIEATSSGHSFRRSRGISGAATLATRKQDYEEDRDRPDEMNVVAYACAHDVFPSVSHRLRGRAHPALHFL